MKMTDDPFSPIPPDPSRNQDPSDTPDPSRNQDPSDSSREAASNPAREAASARVSGQDGLSRNQAQDMSGARVSGQDDGAEEAAGDAAKGPDRDMSGARVSGLGEADGARVSGRDWPLLHRLEQTELRLQRLEERLDRTLAQNDHLLGRTADLCAAWEDYVKANDARAEGIITLLNQLGFEALATASELGLLLDISGALAGATGVDMATVALESPFSKVFAHLDPDNPTETEKADALYREAVSRGRSRLAEVPADRATVSPRSLDPALTEMLMAARPAGTASARLDVSGTSVTLTMPLLPRDPGEAVGALQAYYKELLARAEAESVIEADLLSDLTTVVGEGWEPGQSPLTRAFGRPTAAVNTWVKGFTGAADRARSVATITVDRDAVGKTLLWALLLGVTVLLERRGSGGRSRARYRSGGRPEAA